MRLHLDTAFVDVTRKLTFFTQPHIIIVTIVNFRIRQLYAFRVGFKSAIHKCALVYHDVTVDANISADKHGSRESYTLANL